MSAPRRMSEAARWSAYEAAKREAQECAESAEDYERMVQEAARRLGL